MSTSPWSDTWLSVRTVGKDDLVATASCSEMGDNRIALPPLMQAPITPGACQFS